MEELLAKMLDGIEAPPIRERIRILRAMAGASYVDYERAYKQLKGKGIVPALALATGATALPVAAPPVTLPEVDKIEQARQTSNLMWRLNNYQTITCECGTKLRVPPNFKEPNLRCPHCGRIHQLREATQAGKWPA